MGRLFHLLASAALAVGLTNPLHAGGPGCVDYYWVTTYSDGSTSYQYLWTECPNSEVARPDYDHLGPGQLVSGESGGTGVPETWEPKNKTHYTNLGLWGGKQAFASTEVSWKVSNYSQVKDSFIMQDSAGWDMSSSAIAPSSSGPTDSIITGYTFSWSIESGLDGGKFVRSGNHKWLITPAGATCNDSTMKNQ